MAYYSYNVNAFSLPFANIENKVLFKLFMVDPGLVCYMSLSGRQFEVMNGTIDVNEVALSEEFVAAELSKKGIDLHLNLAQKASDVKSNSVLPESEGLDASTGTFNGCISTFQVVFLWFCARLFRQFEDNLALS